MLCCGGLQRVLEGLKGSPKFLNFSLLDVAIKDYKTIHFMGNTMFWFPLIVIFLLEKGREHGITDSIRKEHRVNDNTMGETKSYAATIVNGR